MTTQIISNTIGNPKLFRAYAELIASIKELEGKRDGLKVKIIADFHAKDIQNVKSDFGTFALGSRPTYAYSKKIEGLEQEVRQLKRNEEDSGKAKVVKTSEYLTFRS